MGAEKRGEAGVGRAEGADREGMSKGDEFTHPRARYGMVQVLEGDPKLDDAHLLERQQGVVVPRPLAAELVGVSRRRDFGGVGPRLAKLDADGRPR